MYRSLNCSTTKEMKMFESIEIRRAANGFIMIVNSEDDNKEFIYDTERKLMRAIKQQLGQRLSAEDVDD